MVIVDDISSRLSSYSQKLSLQACFGFKSDYFNTKKILESAEDIAGNKALIGSLNFTYQFQIQLLLQFGAIHDQTKELEELIREQLETMQ